jgi:small subunit ribosomal protein S1
VVELSPEKQKAAFSIRDYHKKLQKDEMSRYMTGNEADDVGTFTLADILKSKEKEAE